MSIFLRDSRSSLVNKEIYVTMQDLEKSEKIKERTGDQVGHGYAHERDAHGNGYSA